MTTEYLHYFGYAASGLIAISLLISNIWYFRWINMTGAFLFSVYGLLIGAVPVAALNGLITVINLTFIVKMFRKVDYFHYLMVTYRDSPYLQYFLRYYTRDIGHYFPRFQLDKRDPEQRYSIVLRNAIPVGVFSYHKEGDCAVIDLDYTIPAYRDLKNTRYLIEHALADEFKEQGINRLCTYTSVAAHVRYILKMGFYVDPEIPHLYHMNMPAR